MLCKLQIPPTSDDLGGLTLLQLLSDVAAENINDG